MGVAVVDLTILEIQAFISTALERAATNLSYPIIVDNNGKERPAARIAVSIETSIPYAY